jgi:hypothetical protein
MSRKHGNRTGHAVERTPGPQNHEPWPGGAKAMTKTRKSENLFSLGSQVGGSDAAEATQQAEQGLRDLLNEWTGEYSGAIREFAFLLRVDGEIDSYTEKWKIQGAQKAKRKKDWIEVEIGVPESWWREDQGRNIKMHLAAEIEKALHSMIEVLMKKGLAQSSFSKNQ